MDLFRPNILSYSEAPAPQLRHVTAGPPLLQTGLSAVHDVIQKQVIMMMMMMMMMSFRSRSTSRDSAMQRAWLSPSVPEFLRLKSMTSLGPHHEFSRYHVFITHCIITHTICVSIILRSESSSPHHIQVRENPWILGDDGDDGDSLPSYSKTISGPTPSRTGITSFHFDNLPSKSDYDES